MNTVKYIATNIRTGVETPLDADQYKRFKEAAYASRFTFREVKEPEEVTRLKDQLNPDTTEESAEDSK